MDTLNEVAPILTEKDKVRGMTNDPSLSENTITLGTGEFKRDFKILDLEYDDYVTFLSYLQPLMEVALGKLASFQGIAIPQTSEINAASLLAYCANDLPEMVRIVCKGTDPDITTTEIKKLVKNPFKMASIVLEQINHNKMIKDFSDFFMLILPLIKPQTEVPPTKKKK
jgi:hypothetical protein